MFEFNFQTNTLYRKVLFAALNTDPYGSLEGNGWNHLTLTRSRFFVTVSQLLPARLFFTSRYNCCCSLRWRKRRDLVLFLPLHILLWFQACLSLRHSLFTFDLILIFKSLNLTCSCIIIIIQLPWNSLELNFLGLCNVFNVHRGGCLLILNWDLPLRTVMRCLIPQRMDSIFFLGKNYMAAVSFHFWPKLRLCVSIVVFKCWWITTFPS